MEYLAFLADNMAVIGAAILAFLAGFDKIALIAIHTLANIRDAWKQSFPTKKLVINIHDKDMDPKIRKP